MSTISKAEKETETFAKWQSECGTITVYRKPWQPGVPTYDYGKEMTYIEDVELPIRQ